MGAYTSFLNLFKPSEGEAFDEKTQQNDNWDRIEAFAKTTSESIGQYKSWGNVGILDSDFENLTVIQALTYISDKIGTGEIVQEYVSTKPFFLEIFPEGSGMVTEISKPYPNVIHFQFKHYILKTQGYRKFYKWGAIGFEDSGYYELATV